MRTTLKAKVGGRRSRLSGFVRTEGKNVAKAVLIEPFLIVASSLLWIMVLPFAALVCSGIAISDLVEAT
jgi:hypothetical protein